MSVNALQERGAREEIEHRKARKVNREEEMLKREIIVVIQLMG